MFELNLIKDKAKARQRRRIIFLTITSVCFLAALSSMFVVSLYLKELNDTNVKVQEVGLKDATFAKQKGDNDVDEPKFKRRRNSLIQAWDEDINFINKRPVYTPVLNLLSTEKPNAQFWYSSIEIRLVLTSVGATPTPGVAQIPAVMAPRALRADGMINITESDVQTQKQLERMADHMNFNDNFVSLVGPAKASLHLVSEGQNQGTQMGETSRWNEFDISASRAGAIAP